MSVTNDCHLSFCDFFWAEWKISAQEAVEDLLKVSIIPVFQGESNGDGPESLFDVWNAEKCNFPHFTITVR